MWNLDLQVPGVAYSNSCFFFATPGIKDLKVQLISQEDMERISKKVRPAGLSETRKQARLVLAEHRSCKCWKFKLYFFFETMTSLWNHMFQPLRNPHRFLEHLLFVFMPWKLDPTFHVAFMTKNLCRPTVMKGDLNSDFSQAGWSCRCIYGFILLVEEIPRPTTWDL